MNFKQLKFSLNILKRFQLIQSCNLSCREFKQSGQIYNNKNEITILTKRFAFAPVIASTSLNLIQMGFSQSEYASIEAVFTTSWILSSLLVSKYLQRGKEMTWYRSSFCLGDQFYQDGRIQYVYIDSLCKYILISQFILQYIYEFNNQFISCALYGLTYFTVIKDKLLKLQFFDLKSWKAVQ